MVKDMMRDPKAKCPRREKTEAQRECNLHSNLVNSSKMKYMKAKASSTSSKQTVIASKKTEIGQEKDNSNNAV